ncbi:hydroxyphenylacetyl-CoA thioesterase PaaI [Hoeflea prorocentri]|uniref:Hydroxyphenylacetyl-CoA thioesterase PaaI n=1 Tax=Hoeflea prorocentri TaxID=1922333 RepID=A0A9X3ZHA6_9HYPH|nr:hydroxyphenylacetyl-CoA thioesterase PaaI [Hoeflea prorocentri]MCY6380698.1 hydroxyphenylacetyl-CoA thioesterase PaaI [Hoeflea prorocentri]MDA5398498.1 hydroxyphenylacetyl-CoA thioesterase PaaI [Hoeflea prorocentri]
MGADELARACAEAMWENDKASKHMGMQIEDISAGSATLSMTVLDHMTNGHDICHGGFIFTLADSAFAFACNGYNQNAVAQQCAITFLAPVKSGEKLTATASEVQRAGRGGIYDIRVTRNDGEVIAEFRGHSRTVKGTHLPVES